MRMAAIARKPRPREVIAVQLGFFTACLPGHDLESIAQQAASTGFAALEVAAWPSQSREHTASHINVGSFGPADCEAIQDLFCQHGLTLSAVSCYDNNLHPDQRQRA